MLLCPLCDVLHYRIWQGPAARDPPPATGGGCATNECAELLPSLLWFSWNRTRRRQEDTAASATAGNAEQACHVFLGRLGVGRQATARRRSAPSIYRMLKNARCRMLKDAIHRRGIGPRRRRRRRRTSRVLHYNRLKMREEGRRLSPCYGHR